MTADIDALLKTVTDEVEQLRTRLSEGAASDSVALESKLNALMTALQAAPVEVGKTYVTNLADLQHSLTELQTDFARQQAAAQETMQMINTRLKAATAYTKSAAAKLETSGESE